MKYHLSFEEQFRPVRLIMPLLACLRLLLLKRSSFCPRTAVSAEQAMVVVCCSSQHAELASLLRREDCCSTIFQRIVAQTSRRRLLKLLDEDAQSFSDAMEAAAKKIVFPSSKKITVFCLPEAILAAKIPLFPAGSLSLLFSRALIVRHFPKYARFIQHFHIYLTIFPHYFIENRR